MRVANNKVQEEDGLELIRKVINLNSEQRKLVNKLLDASDQCKDIIDTLLSSTNPILDLVQKIIRANTEELNLLRKITELNCDEWELARKFLCLCNREKYFICKFLDWYVKDECFGFSCSCSSLKEVDTCEDRTCNLKKYDDNVGNLRTMVSSYKSQQGKSDEKVVAYGTNQCPPKGELHNSCSEKVFLLAEGCAGNRNIASEVHLTERCGSSVECRTEKEAQPVQPAMTEKKLMCHEHQISHSSWSSKDFYGRPVSHVEHNDGGFQLKGTKQKDDERDEGNCTSAVSTLCSTKQGETLVLTTENMDKKVHQPERHSCLPEVNNELLQGNKVNVSASSLSAMKSSGILSQNEIGDDCLFQAEGRTETQHDVPGKESNKTVCSKGTECGNSVLVTGENLGTVLGDDIQNVYFALSGKESMEIISDTHDSVLMTRRITSSLPGNKCSVQPEIEIKNADSNFSEPEFLLHESKLEKSKRTVFDYSKKKYVSFSPGNAKVESGNLITISGDVTKNGDVHLSGKEMKNISDTHDSLLTVKKNTNSVSVTSCSVQPNINNRRAKLNDSGQKAAPLYNITDEETLILPENMKVNTENLTKESGDKPENVIGHLSGKESKNMITDTHHSFSTVRSVANSESEKSCLGQKKIESKDAKSRDHRQERLPPQTKVRKARRALDNTVEKEISLPLKNVKMKSQNLSTISGEQIEEAGGYVFRKKKEKISNTYDYFLRERRSTNSLAEKTCFDQAETESEYTQSDDDGKELVSPQLKLKNKKRSVLDKKTESCQEIKNSSVMLESKCEEECSVISDHLAAKEADVLLPGSKKIIQLTEKMKLHDDIKHKKMQLCMKKMGILVEGINMFNIATSMTQLLHTKEEKISATLIRKAERFFAEAKTIYSSLEKYLHKLQCDEEKRTREKLSICASQMLQCLLKLQHNISLRHTKIGMNMKVIITDITHVMDVIGEVITIATEELHPKSYEGFVLNDCYVRLEDIAHVLKGKKTVNLKDLKESREDRMRKSPTENTTLNVNDCGFKRFGNTYLNTKRKRDKIQRCYGNIKKRRTETSEDRVFKVFQRHEPIEYAAIEISIPADDEQVHNSTKWDQDSANSELIHSSVRRIKVITSHEAKEISRGVQVPVRHQLTEFSTNKPQVYVYQESVQHSTNGFQIPINHEQTELSTDESQVDLHHESMVYIKQEIIDFETDPISASGESSYVCEETFTNWEDVVVKEEMAIELNPDFEDLECGQEMICLASSVGTADDECQSLNIEEMNTVVLACSEGVPEETQFTGGHRQLEHNVSEIQSQELRCNGEGSHQSVESIRSTEYMGAAVLNEDAAGECVEQTGSLTLRAKPDLSGQSDVMLRRPCFGTAKKDVNETEKALGIHMQPFSVERVGSLKWIQYIVGIDHPYSRETEESPIKKCSLYICEICAKVIHSASNINKHMNSHFRYSAVTCNYCGKWICSFQHWTKHKKNCFAANEGNVISPE